MDELYEKLKNYNIDSAIEYENNDTQYIALTNLWNKLENNDKHVYLSFIIANALICYQLSWKGEEYWEEFSDKLFDYIKSWKKDILEFFEDFLPNSKNNKRFVNIKISRIKKVIPFLERFRNNELYYYENMNIILAEIWKVMKQKLNAKTIVFSIKMFSYWARNCFWKLIYFPNEITIPIDSRLVKIYEKYWKNEEKIEVFYSKISSKLWIPELHLDAIIWNNKELY